VEDDTEINNYIKSELAPLYRIHQCPNGKEALEYILKAKPDLVVSDIMMPIMDGISLCKKIKSNINTEHIPVVLLTAKSHEEDLSEGLTIGADAYIVKPFNPKILKKTIANLLGNRERLKGKHRKQTENKVDKIELKTPDELLMARVMRIVNENLNKPNFSVNMLSDRVGMSRVHLHRKLKELTNQSAGDFIKSIRLKQAAELLKSKNMSISEVAYRVGFSTLSHFSSSFKEFHGVSPTEFLANNS
jgi:YesN/AraC family two-component response regulator